MSDAELRRLVREAEALGGSTAWLKAGQALSRAGRHEEAGRAALLAEVAGALAGEVTSLRDTLAPRSLASFGVRTIGVPSVGALSQPTWSADGTTLYTVANKRTVLAWDVDTGRFREVATLSQDIVALAASAVAPRLAVAQTSGNVTRLRFVDLAARTVSEPFGTVLRRVHALSFPGELVLAAGLGGAAAFTLAGEECWKLEGRCALDASTVAAVRENAVEWHAPPSLVARLDLEAIEWREPVHELALAGTRAVLVSGAERLEVVEPTGQRLEGGKPRWAERTGVLAASPSGAIVAALARSETGHLFDREVHLVDARSGRTTEFFVDAFPAQLAWAPSGRRLAAPTPGGTVVLLEANVEANDWVDMHTETAFFRIRRTHERLEYWRGRLGGKGERYVMICPGEEQAQAELERLVRAQEHEGFKGTPQEPPRT